MPREKRDWRNCAREGLPITVSVENASYARPVRFCGELHAAAWLMQAAAEQCAGGSPERAAIEQALTEFLRRLAEKDSVARKEQ